MADEYDLSRVEDWAYLEEDRVLVDFNTKWIVTDLYGQHRQRVSLETMGSKRDLHRLDIRLKVGIHLKVWMHDFPPVDNGDTLLASGVVDFSKEEGWVVEVLESDIVTLEELLTEAKNARTVNEERNPDPP